MSSLRALASAHDPPCCAATAIERVRVCTPGVPHVAVHADQSDQIVGTQGIGHGGEPSHGRVSASSDGQARPAPACATAIALVRVCVPPGPQDTVHALHALSVTTQSLHPLEHGVAESTTLSAQPAERCATGVVTVRVVR
jgi:hypothetical protein